MSKGLSNVLIFAIGTTIGAVASYFIVKTKLEKTADEKFEEAITEYKNAHERNEKRPDESIDISVKQKATSVTEETSKSSNDLYKEVASRYKYSEDGVDYTKCVTPKEDMTPSEEYSTHERPYVISPDEFGEDYETESLIYYADKIVADDNDVIIDDVEDIIGFDSLNHIGEYETGCIHVRNDVLKKDYEVLQSLRKYSEVAAQRGIFTEG